MAIDDYVHNSFPAGAGKPLLFAFHGTGGDEDQFAGLGPRLLPGAGFVFPRGDVSEHGAARFFRRTGEGVYDMADLAARTARMRGFIAAHKARSGPPATVGLGYSNGANILASVIFAEAGLFDAVVLMHPLIPFEPVIEGGLDGTRILITAGRRDPICPAPLTQSLSDALQNAGADVSLIWHDGGHEIRSGEIEAAHGFLAPYRGELETRA